MMSWPKVTAGHTLPSCDKHLTCVCVCVCVFVCYERLTRLRLFVFCSLAQNTLAKPRAKTQVNAVGILETSGDD